MEQEIEELQSTSLPDSDDEVREPDKNVKKDKQKRTTRTPTKKMVKIQPAVAPIKTSNQYEALQSLPAEVEPIVPQHASTSAQATTNESF